MLDTVIVTDTSTIALFDEEILRHCAELDSDWWTHHSFPELRRELESGNLYLIDTGSDGRFEVTITRHARLPTDLPLNVRSGSVVCVCGEEIPSEGLLPEFIRGGSRIAALPPMVFVRHNVDGNRVAINVSG